MTYFTSLPPSLKSVLLGALFLAVMSLLTAIIYTFINRKRTKSFIPNCVLFTTSLVLVSYLSSYEEKAVSIPFFAIILFCTALFVYSGLKIAKEFKISRNTLSPFSLKQALDNLNSGICFSDENGRVVLINHTMGKLISFATGKYPQALDEIKNALKNHELVSKVGDVENTYLFKSGDIWKFSFLEISDEELKGFSQIYAQNVSDLFEVNRKLKEENEKLQKANEETAVMLERLADRIREEETLKLKMQIHDDIGTSLIKIAKIMQGDKNENMEHQLALLENAIGFFSNNRALSKNSADELLNKAEAMGIKLTVNPKMPENSAAEELIILATNECLTNCVIHAKGSEVFVDIKKNQGCYYVTITNNGEAPKQPIKEGGGLASLRRIVEDKGGEMALKYEGGFALELVIRED